MLRMKRLGKSLSCLLLAVIAIMTTVIPASAISCFASPLSVSMGQSTVQLEEASETKEVLVSVLRRYASASSEIVGRFENGTQIKILGSTGTFYKVDCYDMNAYIAKSQVRVGDDGNYYVNCVSGSSETATMPVYSLQDALSLKSALRSRAMKYLGTPYVWGGQTPNGFDCSGYTQYVFAKNNLSIHRTVINQLGDGIVIKKEDLQVGDLIIFSNTTSRGFASHVGMYIGDGKMIHSGNGGVAISSLDTPYWNKYYQGARRIILTGLTESAAQPTIGLIQNTTATFWRRNTRAFGLGVFYDKAVA